MQPVTVSRSLSLRGFDLLAVLGLEELSITRTALEEREADLQTQQELVKQLQDGAALKLYKDILIRVCV